MCECAWIANNQRRGKCRGSFSVSLDEVPCRTGKSASPLISTVRLLDVVFSVTLKEDGSILQFTEQMLSQIDVVTVLQGCNESMLVTCFNTRYEGMWW